MLSAVQADPADAPLGYVEGIPVELYNADMLPGAGDEDGGLESTYTPVNPPNGHVHLIVERGLSNKISAALDLYTACLVADGFTVSMQPVGNGTGYWSIKSFIQDVQVQHADLSGVVFIGDFFSMPQFEVEWYDTEDEEDKYRSGVCDFYFMDLDGTWNDTDGNGIFDEHPIDGNHQPDIWVSRINPKKVGDEVELAEAYFRRLYDYRTGRLTFPERALLYIDDDWTSWEDDWGDSMEELYPGGVTKVFTPGITTAQDLKDQLDGMTYEYLHNAAHASPSGYSYSAGRDDDGEKIPGGTIRSTELPTLNWRVGFHTWFHCSFANHTSQNFGAGEYIFNTDWGIAGVGSANTGGMTPNDTFYESLALGATMGEAMLHWLRALGTGGYDTSFWRWNIGATCIGDGTAVPEYTPRSVPLPDLRSWGQQYSDFAPRTIAPWEAWHCEWGVHNGGTAAAGPFDVEFYASTDSDIDPDEDHYLGTKHSTGLAPGQGSVLSLDLADFPRLAEGYYFIGVVIDPGKDVAESAETNNTSFDDDWLLRVQYPPRPDLVGDVESAHGFAPQTVYYGQTWDCTWSILNVGEGTVTDNFAVLFFGSADRTIVPGEDVLLGSTTVTQDIPGGGAVLTTLHDPTFPESVPEGDYYVGVAIDYFDNVDESDEDNNLDVKTAYRLHVAGAPLPDLVDAGDEFSSFWPTQVDVDDPWHFEMRIANVGLADLNLGPSDSFFLRIYLSEDSDIDPAVDSMLLSKPLADDIPAGSYIDVQFDTTWVWADPGCYYVGAFIDGTERIAESDETNNISVDLDTGLLLIGDWPDLAPLAGPSSTFAPQTIWPGDAWGASCPVRNWGLVDAGTFAVAFFLSEDTEFDIQDDRYLGAEWVTGGLAAETTTVVNRHIDHFPDVEPGDYYLFVVADSGKAVTEADELNNVGYDYDTYPLRVMGPTPDLSPAGPAGGSFSPQTVAPGQPWSASWKVNNIGNGSAWAFYADYYASIDQTIDPAEDYYLGSAWVEYCYAGLYATANIHVSEFPAVPPGSYYVGMFADREDSIFERDEANNIRVIQTYPLTVVWSGTGGISGSKFNDLDNDGVRDAGEPALSGWTVYLDQNRNGQRDPNEPFDVTDGSGAYSFTNLPPGVFYVAEDSQPGWLQTYPKVADVTGQFAIDFDDVYAPRLFGETRALRDHYAPLGVHFAAYHPSWPDDGGAILNDTTGYGVTGHSSPNYLALNGFEGVWMADGGQPHAPQVIAFDYPVSAVAFQAGTWYTSETLTAEAYDARNCLVDTATATLTGSMQTLSLASPAGITRLVVTSATPTEMFVIDDLSWTGGAPTGEHAVVLTSGQNVTGRDFGNYEGGLPDLVEAGEATSSYYPATVSQGDYWELYWDFRNVGTGEAGQFDVAFYASVDQDIDPLEDSLLATETISGLGAGGYTGVEIYLDSFPNVHWGNYYVGVVIDPDNAVIESDESNNTAVDLDDYPLHVLGPGQPDLMSAPHGQRSVAPNPATIGQPWTGRWEVRNDGDAPAGPFNVSLYLSVGLEFDPSTSELLGTVRYASGLAALTSAVAELSLSSFPAMPTGDYYLCVDIDPGGEVDEYLESNNRATDDGTYPVMVAEAPAPADLVSGADGTTGFEPVTVAAGDYWDGWWGIDNVGGTAAGPFKVSFYASADTTFDPFDYLLGTAQVAGVPAGGSASAVLSLYSFPAYVPPGQFYLCAVIDVDEDVAESNEANNFAADLDPYPLTVLGPDLLETGDAGSWFDPDEVVPGMPWFARWEVRNAGGADAGRFEVNFYASSDSLIDPATDTLLGSALVTGLPAGQTTVAELGLSSFPDLPAGDYYVGLFIDYDNDIYETNEQNNLGLDLDDYPLTVSTAPDPADLVANFDDMNGYTPRTVAPGDYLEAWWGIHNAGQTAAGPFNVAFYASLDDVVTPSDYHLGTTRVSGLGAGDWCNAGLSVESFPDIPAGEYYVGVILDADDEVSESDELNNTDVDSDSDYPLTVEYVARDFGDAPEGYDTLLVDNGARHVLAGPICLGQLVDDEPDGLPDEYAEGDDNAGDDDEDGVILPGSLTPGQTAQVEVTTIGSGYLQAWIDFGGDGGWGQPADHIVDDRYLTPGTVMISFDVPPDATVGTAYARFRYSSDSGLDWTGLASDGEVEDYQVTIAVQAASISGTKFHDRNGNREFNGGEPGLAGWEIYIDEDDNGSHDAGEPLVQTDSQGHYTFADLEPGTYTIAEVCLPYWVQSCPASETYGVTVAAGEAASGYDFGNCVMGDANGDGRVGIADLGAVADNYGTVGGAVWRMGDFNFDGKVGIADLGALSDNYGFDMNGAAATGGAVSAGADTAAGAAAASAVTEADATRRPAPLAGRVAPCVLLAVELIGPAGPAVGAAAEAPGRLFVAVGAPDSSPARVAGLEVLTAPELPALPAPVLWSLPGG